MLFMQHGDSLRNRDEQLTLYIDDEKEAKGHLDNKDLLSPSSKSSSKSKPFFISSIATGADSIAVMQ
jgi:hypothetical protein